MPTSPPSAGNTDCGVKNPSRSASPRHRWTSPDIFERSDSPNVPKFIHWGLKSVGNAEIRDLYEGYVDRKIETLGFDLPDQRTNRRFL